MLVALVLIPLLLAAVAFAIPSQRLRPWVVPVGGLAHATVTALALAHQRPSSFHGWLVLDPLGKLVLALLSLLYLLCALYTPGYLALRRHRPNRTFCAALLGFLAMMSLVVLSHHLG